MRILGVHGEFAPPGAPPSCSSTSGSPPTAIGAAARGLAVSERRTTCSSAIDQGTSATKASSSTAQARSSHRRRARRTNPRGPVGSSSTPRRSGQRQAAVANAWAAGRRCASPRVGLSTQRESLVLWERTAARRRAAAGLAGPANGPGCEALRAGRRRAGAPRSAACHSTRCSARRRRAGCSTATIRPHPQPTRRIVPWHRRRVAVEPLRQQAPDRGGNASRTQLLDVRACAWAPQLWSCSAYRRRSCPRRGGGRSIPAGDGPRAAATGRRSSP